LRFEKAMRS